MDSLSAANTKLCFDISRELKNEDGNIVFSSFSISAAASILLLGARGNTALQIENAGHYNEVAKINTPGVGERLSTSPEAVWDTHREFHSQFHHLLAEMNKPNDAYSLAIANRLYGSQTFQFLQPYLDSIENLYQASLESMDFLHASEDSRKKINSWVEHQTNGKIKDLFSPGSVDATTILVLVNAIYFKGRWAVQFKRENTEKTNFRTNTDTSRPVQMMKQTGFFNMGYFGESQGKIIELPYTNKHLSMFVLLPTDTGGLEKLEDGLTFEKLMELMKPNNMTSKEVVLSLPRFKVEETYSLRSTLENMGMTDIFNAQRADFSGMTTHRGMAVSKIIHKSYVEVNEEGTEAAAATGSLIAYSAPHREEFICDHPFLFFIQHNKSKSILFYGRVAAP